MVINKTVRKKLHFKFHNFNYLNWAVIHAFVSTYVQKCRQVFFNKFFIFKGVVCRFDITLHVTEFCVL